MNLIEVLPNIYAAMRIYYNSFSGGDAPINELVDFIVAAQIAENLEKETNETICRNELKTEVCFS